MREPLIELSDLVTEQRNPASVAIDEVDTLAMLKIINQEDQKVALAVRAELPSIARAVDIIAQRLSGGGRLVYVGAGTSGRLGILDASECPPTFGVEPTLIRGMIAGGVEAMTSAIEGAEDDALTAQFELRQIRFCDRDVLVGIAASGRTPYVMGAMEWASKVGAQVISISCNPSSPVAVSADIAITPVVGPEVITGSTRLKAGTAQKLVLNMLSTGAMIKLGKVFGNLMVDVQATNDKLAERQIQIVAAATGCTRDAAIAALSQSDNNCKIAIVMLKVNTSAGAAKNALAHANGHTRKALEFLTSRHCRE
jgi:N-acetylmuramic acid 6-phosphate etherase